MLENVTSLNSCWS